MERGHSIWEERADALANTEELLHKHGNAAMYVKDDVVQVVHFVNNSPSMMGRVVRIDEKQRLVYATPIISPQVSFKFLELVHPNVGERMQKVPASERPYLPDKYVQLKSMSTSMIDQRAASLAISECFCASLRLLTGQIAFTVLCVTKFGTLAVQKDC